MLEEEEEGEESLEEDWPICATVFDCVEVQSFQRNIELGMFVV